MKISKMSQLLQDISFGFFDTLPEEAKSHVNDILYGKKAESARPGLPWDKLKERSPSGEKDEEVKDSDTPKAPENVEEDPGPTSSSVPVSDISYVAAEQVSLPQDINPNVVSLPPGHQPNNPGASISMPPLGLGHPLAPEAMYTHPGLPVIPNMAHLPPPPYIMGMIPTQPGIVPVPVNYMPPPPPIPQVLAGNLEPDNNNKPAYGTDKAEASRILGGKTYERRNKKKRPADYYQKLEAAKHASPVQPPMVYQPIPQPVSLYAPSQIPPPNILHYHPPSSNHMAPTIPTIMNHGVVTSVLPPSTHPGPAVSVQFIPPGAPVQGPPSGAHVQGPPPGAPVQGPPPPQYLPGAIASTAEAQNTPPTAPNPSTHVLAQSPNSAPTTTHIDSNQHAPVGKVEVVNVNQSGESSQPDIAQSAASEPACKPVEPEVEDSSLASEIFSDNSRTESGPQTNFMFGEVDSELTNKNHDKEMFPWHISNVDNNNVPKVSEVVMPKAEDVLVPAPAETEEKKDNSHAPPATSNEIKEQDTTGANKQQPSEATQPETRNEPQPGPESIESLPKVAAPPVRTSWAGLFKGTQSAETATVIYGSPNANSTLDTAKPSTEVPNKAPETFPEKTSTKLGVIVRDHCLSFKPPSIQPRGLINRSNWCYVNSTLQSLLACPPLYNLLKRIPPAAHLSPSTTPILDSIVEFVNEFSPMPEIKLAEKNLKGSGPKGNIKHDVPTGPMFEVTHVYKMLQQIQYDGFKTGRQEDAEEFLSCVLNGLHEEMVAAVKALEPSNKDLAESEEVTTNGNVDIKGENNVQDEQTDDSGWEQVGPKNKSVVTRATNFDSSPISDIFRGQFRNTLSRPGFKESATLQPFFTLQLDIQSEKVLTVQDALENLVSRETLQDFTCSKTNTEVDASRRTMLEDLPPVLILHLKCFVFDKSGGCQKVVKKVDFSNELEISKDLLSPPVRVRYPQQQRKYKLFAVVKHVGVRAAGGHYTADVYYPSLGEWLHLDDSNVNTVSMPQVFKFRSPKIPYLLYYRRADLN